LSTELGLAVTAVTLEYIQKYSKRNIDQSLAASKSL
jgi:hypothetical protein